MYCVDLILPEVTTVDDSTITQEFHDFLEEAIVSVNHTLLEQTEIVVRNELSTLIFSSIEKANAVRNILLDSVSLFDQKGILIGKQACEIYESHVPDLQNDPTREHMRIETSEKPVEKIQMGLSLLHLINEKNTCTGAFRSVSTSSVEHYPTYCTERCRRGYADRGNSAKRKTLAEIYDL